MIRRALTNLHRDERGVVVVMVGALLGLLLVFAVYAIDASQMMLVRTQLQNAADAGALAGALIGALTDDTTAAQDEAILAAGANSALQDSGGARNRMESVVIGDADVTFPQARKITVTTHRTEATGDQFLNYFMRIFSNDNSGVGEMTARASAEWAWVCGGKCLMPWAPPDRWCDSAGTGDCSDGDEIFDSAGGEYYDPITTGYTDADLGDPITIVLGNGSQGFGMFDYYSIDFPPINKGNPISGADQYVEWMCEDCEDPGFAVEPGDQLRVEPGKQTGPNSTGLECIISSDPFAEWDDATGTVINSNSPISPRIVKCAVFDPSIGTVNYAGGKYVVVTKIIVLFVESTAQNHQQITGRFMRLAEPDGIVCANQNDPQFLFETHLSE